MYADASCLAFVPQSARFMQSLPPRSGFGGKHQPERPSSCPCRKPEDSGNLHKNDATDSGRNERVCNIFRRRFSGLPSLPPPVVNGLRMASEATTPCFAPKYRKIGNRGIFATFPAGKPETSDFFATKYGGFAWKVRRFVPKKSDVFGHKTRHFMNLPTHFFSFLPRNPMNSTVIGMCLSHTIDNTGWQNNKIRSKIRSKRDAMPCQNF